MHNLPKFISILQITREQVQYGYLLAGVNRHETSNLAEHHYLVTMLGWMLCEYLNEDGGLLVDANKVMRRCLSVGTWRSSFRFWMVVCRKRFIPSGKNLRKRKLTKQSSRKSLISQRHTFS